MLNPYGRRGWYVVWWEPRTRQTVVPFVVTDPHGLPLQDSPQGCMIAAPLPASHPLAHSIEAGDMLLRVGTVRVRSRQDGERALTAYAGQHAGLRIGQGGKPGTIRRTKKAGRTQVEADKFFMRWLENRQRAAEGLEPIAAPRPDVTFEKLCDDFLAWACSPASGYSPAWQTTVRSFVGAHRRRWAGYLVREITPAMCAAWHVQRSTEVTPSTVGNELKPLRRMFALARRLGYVDGDPTAGLKIPAPRAARPKYLTGEQVKLLLECAGESDARRLTAAVTSSKGGAPLRPGDPDAMRKWYNADGTFDAARVRFLLLTGLRKSQLAALTWDQVDAVKGTIILESREDHTEKSRRVNVLPLPAAALRIIEGQPRGSRYVFPNLHGDRDDNLHQRFELIRNEVRRRGGGHITLHMLRHTALTALLKHTHDIAAVQRYAGHADAKVTARYAWVLDDDLRDMTRDFDPLKD